LQRLQKNRLPGHLIENEPGIGPLQSADDCGGARDDYVPMSGRVMERKAGDPFDPCGFRRHGAKSSSAAGAGVERTTNNGRRRSKAIGKANEFSFTGEKTGQPA